MHQQLSNYVQTHGDRFVQELMEFLRIPSISTDPKYNGDIADAAELLAEHLEKAGAENVEIMPTEGHPVVYAALHVADDLPTVLVYGHYDVQPADPVELWHSPPFIPEIRDEKIYARGACDDKGQLFMQVKMLEFLTKHKDAPCNLKFLFEGEEEIGSRNLPAFIDKHEELLACDQVLISDTAMLSMETPSIICGLKGVALFEVEINGPRQDLHSGIYGGTVANPLNVLCKMVGDLHDADGRVTIPGFYDGVSVTDAGLSAQVPFDRASFLNETGAPELHGERGFNTVERRGFRPTLDVNGMWGGYTGEGAKTVLPAQAFAKISMRLVPGQTQADIAEKFTTFFCALAPDSVTVSIQSIPGCEPAHTPLNGIGFRAADAAIRQSFGKAPIPTFMGGSIPIVPLFQEKLGVETVLLGFGLDTDNLHSPNEHFALANFFKGIETLPLFLTHFAELWQAENKHVAPFTATL
jgi:acetylornithine deacetylase/succinyl-diaminopimelate desuccinylase-like protein